MRTCAAVSDIINPLLKNFCKPHAGTFFSSCRSEEHTSELQSLRHLVCRLLLERSPTHRDLHSFPTRRSSDLSFRSRNASMIPLMPSPGRPKMTLTPQS